MQQKTLAKLYKDLARYRTFRENRGDTRHTAAIEEVLFSIQQVTLERAGMFALPPARPRKVRKPMATRVKAGADQIAKY